MRSFVKIKPSRNGGITLSFIDIGKSCLIREFFTSLICLLNTIRENKILAKISESTVLSLQFSHFTLFILVDFPIYVDTICMEYIVHFVL